LPGWRDLVSLLRLRHWVKNAFVLMPLPFALATGAEPRWAAFALGVLGMCLASSAVYALNDAADAEQDRLHPEKCERPVASGRVSVVQAHVLAVALAGLGVALPWLSSGASAGGLVVVYLVLNVLYSHGGKDVPLVDVFLISSGFVLRVLLGCALVLVTPSSWLLLCSSTLALFLALAKRRADCARGIGSDHRPSLAGYNLGFLDQASGISAGMTILSYSLYCIEAGVLVPGREFASMPFVLFGVLDYMRVSQLQPERAFPVDVLLSSRPLLVAGIGWVGSVIWSLGLI
jgi:4-hydroxybenzoate polyprenyltransferase